MQYIDEYDFSGQKIKETTSLVDQNGDELKQVFDSDNVQEDGSILQIFDITDIKDNIIAQEERLISVQGDVISSEFMSA